METSIQFWYFSNMTRSIRNRIETCNLFGEEGDFPDVVHCETITARSLLHNWEFADHRHAHLHQFLLVEKGGGEARFENARFALGPMRLINVPIGEVHGFSFLPGTDGWVVTLASEMLGDVLRRDEALDSALSEPRVIPATEPIRAAMVQIFAEFAGRDFARAQVLRGLCGMLVGLAARELVAHAPTATNRRKPVLIEKFEQLVEAHIHDHWSVADYAERLAVSPTHLTRLCRQTSGQPASAIILERLIREARRNLVYTGLPVSTISYALGFEDPAYFSRVFSAATGLSPREFRRQIEAHR